MARRYTKDRFSIMNWQDVGNIFVVNIKERKIRQKFKETFISIRCRSLKRR